MGDTEYRPLAEDDEWFHRYVKYAFRPTGGPWSDEDAEELAENDRVSRENRGLFVPGEEAPVTVAGWHDFRTRIRGEYHRVGGVSAVATPPEHRRKRYVREMLSSMLAEFREEDVAVSALWPFKRSFYRRLGWDTCTRYVEVSAPPAQLRTAGADRSGTFRQFETEDWETLEPVLSAHTEGYGLHVDRTGDWWVNRALDSWMGTPYLYRWDDETGEPRAYLVYRVDEDESGEVGGAEDRVLRVGELAWADPVAYRQLLRFLGDHDSQVGRVRFYLPDGVRPSLHDLVEDPSELTVETKVGPMVRLVDVAEALGRLSYPESVSEELVVGVSDPLVEDNDGSFALAVEGGRATCEPTAASPDAELDVRHLSQLAVGYRDATSLADAGQLDAPAEVVDRLDTAFPTRPTFLREGF